MRYRFADGGLRQRLPSSRAVTRAVDIDCPNIITYEMVTIAGMTFRRAVGCGAKRGNYCNGEGVGADLCNARISAARAATRKKRKP